ncbi:MAG: hypothetical protein JRF02_05430 [Deltaproteobacteria bacterium]|nr:hypothetical protein [Deltaproteobacteria bacterium]
MQKTLINICGSERSGSTMLDLIIGNDPKAFSCGEAYALYRPWRKHHFQPACGCGRECEYLQEFKRTIEDRFHKLLFKKFGYDWVVDSSKDLTWIVDNQKWVFRNNGRVLNLVICKQPPTFTLSFLKRGKNRDYWRMIFIRYYKHFLETELPFVSVCYDEFVQQPEKFIRLICTLVGMEYADIKMNFWEKEHHQLFGSGGTAGQVRAGASEIVRQVEIPPQFIGDVAAVRSRLADDREVGTIIGRLQQRDITAVDAEQESVFNTERFGKKPLWYYKQKVALLLKRYFPESYQQ